MANSLASKPWYLSQIDPFIHYLRAECGLAENTVLAYGRDLKRFAWFCGEDGGLGDPNAIRPLQIQSFARGLTGQKLATATIARHLSAVKMFFRFLVLCGVMQQDQSSLVESPKTWQRLPKVLPRSKTAELVAAFDPQSALLLRDRAIMELLYATGMRASEIAGLLLRDLNAQIGYVRCLGKGKKERIVPVHSVALNACKQYLDKLRARLLGEKPDNGVLFLSRTGRALSRIEVWRIVKRCARNAGMTGPVTPHTLRHCFGSHLLAGGADLRSVQEMLGHANVTTTQIYTHVDADHLRSVHKKFHPRA